MMRVKHLLLFAIFFINLFVSSVVLAAQKDLLILFSDTGGGGLSKNTTLYLYDDWYQSNFNNPKRISDLLKDGWSLLQVVPVNAKQHYWIFEKN